MDDEHPTVVGRHCSNKYMPPQGSRTDPSLVVTDIWAQEKLRQKELATEKIPGADNVADAHRAAQLKSGDASPQQEERH